MNMNAFMYYNCIKTTRYQALPSFRKNMLVTRSIPNKNVHKEEQFVVTRMVTRDYACSYTC